MEQILIRIKDKSKQDFLLELLKEFDFVEIETKSDAPKNGRNAKKFTREQQEFINGLKRSLQQVELHQQGKIKLKTFDEFISEL